MNIKTVREPKTRIELEEIYVRVELDEKWRGFTDQDERRRTLLREAADIRDAAKRHLDCVAAQVVVVDQAVCDFCGTDPEPDEDGLPQCCNAAQEYVEEEEEPSDD